MISGSTDRFISIQFLFSIYFIFRSFAACCFATDKNSSRRQRHCRKCQRRPVLSLIQIPILDLKWRSCDERSLASAIPFPIVRCRRTFDFDVRHMCWRDAIGIHIVSIFIYKNRFDLPQSAHNDSVQVHLSIPLNHLIPMAEWYASG